MTGLRSLIATTTACLAAIGGAGAASPATSSAAEWQVQTHIPGDGVRPNLPLLGITCPSTSLCVAVGELDTIVSTTDPTGGAQAWHVARPTGEADTDCQANWRPPCRDPLDRRIRGVSCPSVQLCVAVTGEGYVYSSTNPTGPGDAWRVADVDGDGRDTHLLGVSCPTTSLCVAVSGERYTSGKVLTSTNPTGGASAWTEVGSPGGPGNLQGVSCAATALCVAGNAGGNLLTATDPTVASYWREANGGVSVQVTGVSCLPSRQCVAVDNNGDAIASTDPAGKDPGWWRTRLIPFVQPASELKEPLNGLFGVSCVSSSFCAVAAADGQIFTSTDPFAEPQDPPRSSARRRKVKRPRITIAKLLLPSLRELREHNAHATVRFHANGAVRRVECKVDRRPFRRCHSPNRFRVAGMGTHSLRIRAVGMTGLRGPTSVKRFWTGKRCHKRQCLVGSGVLRPTAARTADNTFRTE